jgi:hypothetical protein
MMEQLPPVALALAFLGALLLWWSAGAREGRGLETGETIALDDRDLVSERLSLLGRLSDVGAMVVRFERELLEAVRAREGAKVARWVRSPLRDVLLHLEGALCETAGFFQWTAAGLRVRLRRPQASREGCRRGAFDCL